MHQTLSLVACQRFFSLRGLGLFKDYKLGYITEIILYLTFDSMVSCEITGRFSKFTKTINTYSFITFYNYQ